MNCVWNMGTDCAGTVNERLMFSAQLKVPVCDRHYNEHLVVVSLLERGIKQAEVNDATAEERNKMLSDLLKGEDLNIFLKAASEKDSTKNDGQS
jgi:hypothetical protein